MSLLDHETRTLKLLTTGPATFAAVAVLLVPNGKMVQGERKARQTLDALAGGGLAEKTPDGRWGITTKGKRVLVEEGQ